MPTTAPPAAHNGTPSIEPLAPEAPSILFQPAGGTPPPGSGEGMDRQVMRRRFTPRRIAAVLGVLAVVALLAWAIWGRSDAQTLRVDADRLSVSTVEEAPFQEYVAVTGTLQPLRTVFLDAVEGGQVVRRHVEEGDTVSAGQVLFTLRNDDLALEVMGSEAQLEEQAASLRQNRLQ
ncbi:MAG: biotin/lipoyl-binding protein, partial [Bacteroidota bacterium]